MTTPQVPLVTTYSWYIPRIIDMVGTLLSFVVVWYYPVSPISISEETLRNMGKYIRYSDIIMGMVAYQITSLMNVYSTVYSDTDQRKDQSSASLAFLRGSHRGPVNSPHKGPVTWKMFPFDDVIMNPLLLYTWWTTTRTFAYHMINPRLMKKYVKNACQWILQKMCLFPLWNPAVSDVPEFLAIYLMRFLREEFLVIKYVDRFAVIAWESLTANAIWFNVIAMQVFFHLNFMIPF